ncbi:radical SAM protein [Thermodesulfatator autotrophicus]|uniref:Radical SAM protein n=1 Tax=Thermodesulfatator autotrophicus TaxID=1795632 RepID=A0A177E958_9BACT|nr:radical SAM protein [Thermodesulfatator autotrophicus]OAG28338.1 radical SAM protein [Thermodesulfatator autotrophicus]
MSNNFEPAYLKLHRQGKLLERARLLRESLAACNLCPHECGVNRQKGEKGFCRVLDKPVVSSYGPHFGEEQPLVGYGGSGTIFFTYCNMACVYCQNWEISHLGAGEETTAEELARMMLALQARGCHNINFVTPTHQIAFIVEALVIAVEKGLRVPLVYNCGGYERVETLKILDGIIDIYMPDFKYWDEEIALKLSKVPRYPQVARDALKEMHRQVGDLELDDEFIARRGLLVRHLVLPGGLSGTKEVLKFIAEEISPNTYVNIMDQYYPCGDAWKYPPLDRRITPEEYEEALRWAKEVGLKRLDQRAERKLLWLSF